LLDVLNGVERVRIKARGEGIINKKVRNRKQAGIARVFQTIALESAKIIRIAQLSADLLKEVPVMLLALRANLLLQMALEIGGDMVIIEQRIVDVKEENDFGHGDPQNPF
jgi:hypothetical protein